MFETFARRFTNKKYQHWFFYTHPVSFSLTVYFCQKFLDDQALSWCVCVYFQILSCGCIVFLAGNSHQSCTWSHRKRYDSTERNLEWSTWVNHGKYVHINVLISKRYAILKKCNGILIPKLRLFCHYIYSIDLFSPVVSSSREDFQNAWKLIFNPIYFVVWVKCPTPVTSEPLLN